VTPTASPHASSTKISLSRAIAAGLILSVGIGILAFAMTGSNAANRDFISYWAAGHQLRHHANPYDSDQILRMEKSLGYQNKRPLVMRNPPLAFFLALPMGFVGAKTGAVLWSLALIAALMASVRMLWIMNGLPSDRLHLVSYVFPPALACLLAGQMGIFLLFGMTLFLFFHESKPYLAGAALTFCALKPHLFLPFGAVLLLWIVTRRNYRLATGAGIALLGTFALSYFLDPSGWRQYFVMAGSGILQNEFIPTLSFIFRVVVHRDWPWLQFAPVFAGCAWGSWYFLTRRERWSWTDQGLLLLTVSVLVAPYAWFTDEAVLLPAILAGLYQASRRSLLVFSFIAGIALIEVLSGVQMPSGFYLWTAPAWLMWYLLESGAVAAIHDPVVV
jgi:hypothetical protein